MAEKVIQITIKASVRDAEAKLKELQKPLADFERQAKNLGMSVEQSTQDVSKSFWNLENVAKVALGVAASHYVKMAAESVVAAARVAATNIEIASSFESLSARHGLASDKIVKALKRASKGTVDEYSLMLQANKALRLGVATTVDDFEKLMKIAMVRAKEFGLTTAEAWEYIVTGIGRASPLILDNIGILMDANTTYEAYAESIGKTANELTILEQKEAIRQRILREGIPDMERWAEMGDTAADAFARYDTVMTELRQELAEAFLPLVSELAGALADLLNRIKESEEYLDRYKQAEIEAATTQEEAIELLKQRNQALYRGRPALISWQEALQGVTWQEKLAAEATALMTKNVGDWDIKMHDAAAASRQLADSQSEVAEETDDAAKAAERATDIWHDYTQDVAQENWRFAQRVADAQFRAAQAAEDAAFRLQQIQQQADQRREDALRGFDIWYEGEWRKHLNKIRYLYEDHLDELADLEWDYYQERDELMRQAPWWIRRALQREFDERKRIAATGDKDALKQFDEGLKERIRAIDPVYAEELDRLKERYEHEEDIEEKELRKRERRERDSWREQERQRRTSLREQLRQIERGLQDQLRAWEFHNRQRLENERWAMERLITEHNHQLDRMYDDTLWRLSRLDPLYRHYGYNNWLSYVQGWAQSQADHPLAGVPWGDMVGPYPFPTEPFPFQQGISYVPRTMRAILHEGEAVLPAPAAEQYRKGGVTIHIENLNIGAGVSMMSARKQAAMIGTEIGKSYLHQRR